MLGSPIEILISCICHLWKQGLRIKSLSSGPFCCIIVVCTVYGELRNKPDRVKKRLGALFSLFEGIIVSGYSVSASLYLPDLLR